MVIIGAGTVITGFTGVVSANWSLNPNLQRLWQLGSWTPYDTIKQATQEVSITVYAGGGPQISIYPPSSDCTDSVAKFECNIIPASCSTNVEAPSGSFYLSSFSYSKSDVRGYGQESYSGMQWISEGDFTAPTVVLLGISEGQYNGDLTPNQMGVNVLAPEAEGYSGSVSAGFPGLGTADTTYYSIFTEVGLPGAVVKLDGKMGNASVSVPHTPLWIEV